MEITLLEASFSIVLLVWLLASAFCQLRPGVLEEYDVLMMLPQWRFFAPTPAMHDTHLLYRDKMRDGSITNWKDGVDFEDRNFFNFLWNPHRRKRKLVFDVVHFLLLQHQSLDKLSIRLSLPYLILLTYVSKLKHFSEAAETQFVVMTSCRKNGEMEYIPTVISDFHRID